MGRQRKTPTDLAQERELERVFRERMAVIREVEVSPQLKRGTDPNRFYPKECYLRAWHYIEKHLVFDELRLVHGKVASVIGYPVDHAWVEIASDVVFDGVAQRFYDRASYYEVRRAVAEASYSVVEACDHVRRSLHTGPWHVRDWLEVAKERLAGEGDSK